MGREMEARRERAKAWIGDLDFVSREEFEAVKAMAAQAREQVAVLEARIAALEGPAVRRRRRRPRKRHLAPKSGPIERCRFSAIYPQLGAQQDGGPGFPGLRSFCQPRGRARTRPLADPLAR